jgi:hypothetical protein
MLYLRNNTDYLAVKLGKNAYVERCNISGSGSNPKDACTSEEVRGYLEGNHRQLRKVKRK